MENNIILRITKERSEIICFVVQAVLENPTVHAAYIHSINDEGLSNVLKEFLDEVATIDHEHGWCKDPNCKWEGKTDNKSKEGIIMYNRDLSKLLSMTFAACFKTDPKIMSLFHESCVQHGIQNDVLEFLKELEDIDEKMHW